MSRGWSYRLKEIKKKKQKKNRNSGKRERKNDDVIEGIGEKTRFPPPTLDEVEVTIELCVFLDTIPNPPPSSSAYCEGRRLLFVAPAHGNLPEHMRRRKDRRRLNVDVAALAAVVVSFVSDVRALLRHLLPGGSVPP
jgi:hypothetical protein